MISDERQSARGPSKRQDTNPQLDAHDYWLERATDLLAQSLSKWEDEEESVKEEKADHIRDLKGFFRDWSRMKPYLRPVPRVIKTLQAYARLHDGLSEMVEGGRLTESEIPNDYDWLADSLADLAPQIDQILSEVRSVSHRPAYTISESPKGHPMYIRIEMDGRLLCSIGATHGIADWQRQHARRIVEALELLDWISPTRPISSS